MVTAGRYPRQLILYFILGHLRRLARLQADQPPVFAAALDHAIIVGPDRGPKTVPAVHVRADLVLVVPQVLGSILAGYQEGMISLLSKLAEIRSSTP